VFAKEVLMASVIDTLQTSPGRRLLTVADLAALPAELPSGPVKYELHQGRLVTLTAPPGEVHGFHQGTIVFLLKLHGEKAGHGKALGETGLILRRNPDTVVAPDAAFVTKKSLPVRTSKEGYLETIPELVVEVRSKNDSAAELLAKADEYLRAGVQIVWLVDPASRTVVVCRQQQINVELRIGDSVTAAGVIPGFQVPVAEFFGE
jgi:Uma2 family endonuclease